MNFGLKNNIQTTDESYQAQTMYSILRIFFLIFATYLSTRFYEYRISTRYLANC